MKTLIIQCSSLAVLRKQNPVNQSMSTFNHQFVAVAYFCGILSSFQILVKHTLNLALALYLLTNPK